MDSDINLCVLIYLTFDVDRNGDSFEYHSYTGCRLELCLFLYTEIVTQTRHIFLSSVEYVFNF